MAAKLYALYCIPFFLIKRSNFILAFIGGDTLNLIPVVVWLYLTLIHATSDFSLPLAHHGSAASYKI
jgi:hypothetical protein